VGLGPAGAEGEEVELAGGGVELGVGGETPGASGEIDPPDGVEVRRQLIGE
jgi:hypothetical protein